MLCNDCKETTELIISYLSPELQVSSPPRILQGSLQQILQILQIRLFIFGLEKVKSNTSEYNETRATQFAWVLSMQNPDLICQLADWRAGGLGDGPVLIIRLARLQGNVRFTI